MMVVRSIRDQRTDLLIVVVIEARHAVVGWSSSTLLKKEGSGSRSSPNVEPCGTTSIRSEAVHAPRVHIAGRLKKFQFPCSWPRRLLACPFDDILGSASCEQPYWTQATTAATTRSTPGLSQREERAAISTFSWLSSATAGQDLTSSSARIQR